MTAVDNGLDPYVFDLIVKNESHWNPQAVSKTHDHGLVQINLHYHPEVSLKEANDPSFALPWMARMWKQGHAREWTTYRAYAGIK